MYYATVSNSRFAKIQVQVMFQKPFFELCSVLGSIAHTYGKMDCSLASLKLFVQFNPSKGPIVKVLLE
jgi:hypothetical protein